MSFPWLWALVLVSGVLDPESTSRHPGQSASSTQQTIKVFVDPGPWPQTLREVWATSPLIVHGVVASTDPPRIIGDHGLGRNHTVRIIEVLKSALVNPPGSSVVVRQLGGTVVTNNRTDVSTTLPDVILREGQEYILFLGPSNEVGTFVIRYDSAAFLVGPAARLVSMPTAATRLAELKGKREFAVQDFLALVRAFRDKP